MKRIVFFSSIWLTVAAVLLGLTLPPSSGNTRIAPAAAASGAMAQTTATPAATWTPQQAITLTVTPSTVLSPSLPVTTVLVPENLSAGDPYAPELGNRGYDVERYVLHLALDPQVIGMEASVRLNAVSTSENLRQISLDFVGFEISSVMAGGTPASFFRQNKKLLVNLPQPLAKGQAFSLEIDYAGKPVQEKSDFVPFIPSLGLEFRENNIYVVSEPDGARYWFPCNDHPRDKATYRFEIVVPDGYTGVANGKLIDTQKGVARAFADGRPGDLYVWEHNFPMASYLATVAVGQYIRVESTSPKGTPLRSYVFPDQRVEFEQKLPAVSAALDWMSGVLGPYPFEEFGYVMVKQLDSSLETQTMVILDQNSDTGTMIHEMVHMWFGDWVTPDSWGDMWRDEGFATYATLWFGARTNPSALDQQITQSIKNLKPVPYGLTNPPRDQLYGALTYVKGSGVYNALSKEMGEQAFVDGLDFYMRDYGGSVATNAEFQAAMERAAGKPLVNLFSDWLK